MKYYRQELKKVVDHIQGLDQPALVGYACYGRLSEDIRLRVEFINAHSCNYDTLKVTLINRQSGIIDDLSLSFRDIFQSTDLEIPRFWQGCYTAPNIKGNQPGWIGFQPTQKDYQKIADVISDYIAVFQEQDVVLNHQMSM